ncbi:hypothetical protein VCR15J2_20398 [Vibrio coralliirubri]|nr:hypothetical protein VCR15J2_20398 [Vibrio coralliirubri]CDT74619.1 hypothetical protein VCR8J2_190206 [Vibrio coralliirubri]CDT76269.1 hypothetical protein VCR26J2_370272 [Vibrio coralliirubri]
MCAHLNHEVMYETRIDANTNDHDVEQHAGSFCTETDAGDIGEN